MSELRFAQLSLPEAEFRKAGFGVPRPIHATRPGATHGIENAPHFLGLTPPPLDSKLFIHLQSRFEKIFRRKIRCEVAAQDAAPFRCRNLVSSVEQLRHII